MQPIQIVGINGNSQVNSNENKTFLYKINFNLFVLFYKLYADLLIDVKYDGTVSATPTALIKVACKTDVGNFPFDEKQCTLTFGW